MAKSIFSLFAPVGGFGCCTDVGVPDLCDEEWTTRIADESNGDGRKRKGLRGVSEAGGRTCDETVTIACGGATSL